MMHSLRASLRYYARGFGRYLRHGHAFFYAAGIAFYAVLCIIPFLLLVTWLTGNVLSASLPAASNLQAWLEATMPQGQYAHQIKISLERVIDEVVRGRSSYGWIGVVILTWTSMTLFGAVRTVLGIIYHLKSVKPFLLAFIEEFVLLIVLGILLLVTSTGLWASSFVTPFLEKIFSLGVEQAFTGAVALLSSVVPAFIMFYLVNKLIPGKGVSRQVAAIAATASTALWIVAGKVFGWYITAFHAYSMLYGAYASVFVFLVWVYISSFAFIVGAIVGQLFRDRHEAVTRFS
jgi:membrane protein